VHPLHILVVLRNRFSTFLIFPHHLCLEPPYQPTVPTDMATYTHAHFSKEWAVDPSVPLTALFPFQTTRIPEYPFITIPPIDPFFLATTEEVASSQGEAGTYLDTRQEGVDCRSGRAQRGCGRVPGLGPVRR
jgi:hypothetical protein